MKQGLTTAQNEYNDIKNSDDTTGLFEAQQAVKAAKLALKLGNKLDDGTRSSQKKMNNFINFSELSANEIMDEMNVKTSDTLRALIENLPDNLKRERLINIQKQIIADTLRNGN